MITNQTSFACKIIVSLFRRCRIDMKELSYNSVTSVFIERIYVFVDNKLKFYEISSFTFYSKKETKYIEVN